MAQKITESLSIQPSALERASYCDGQVLVINDMLGMFKGHIPKFVKKLPILKPLIMEALKAYKNEVEAGTFPGEEHGYTINDDVLEKLY